MEQRGGLYCTAGSSQIQMSELKRKFRGDPRGKRHPYHIEAEGGGGEDRRGRGKEVSLEGEIRGGINPRGQQRYVLTEGWTPYTIRKIVRRRGAKKARHVKFSSDRSGA